MLVTYILACALLVSSVLGQSCNTKGIIKDTSFLIKKLKDDPMSKCSCSGNVTSCLCLSVPSDDCTTPCYQEGLSQVTNATRTTDFWFLFNRVKRTVDILKSNKCPFFSCEKPCNQTIAGNTLSFLERFLMTLQNKEMQEKVWRIQEKSPEKHP